MIAADNGQAAIKKPGIKDLGGVDFNPQNLQLKTSGKGSDMNSDISGMEGLQVDGLTPVIFNIVPVSDPMALISWSD